jgi:hypothetical protein
MIANYTNHAANEPGYAPVWPWRRSHQSLRLT